MAGQAAGGATISTPTAGGMMGNMLSAGGTGQMSPGVVPPSVGGSPVPTGVNPPLSPAPAPAPAPSPAAPNVFQQAQAGQTAAMAGTAAGMGYQPQQVSVGGTMPQVTAGQIAEADLSAYFNPFENTVVQQSLGDIEKARQMQANQLAAQAQAAGAFGGSRSAILESQAGQAAMEQAARTAANLRLGGFQNAQQMAGQDITTRLQAALANQGAAGQDLNRQLQAALANQQAGLTGASQRLGAAAQMGGLAQQAFGMGRNLQQDMAQQGALQQMLQQQVFDRAQQQFQGFSGFPQQSLSYLASALGAAPVPQSTTTSRQPGLFDYLTLGLSMG